MREDGGHDGFVAAAFAEDRGAVARVLLERGVDFPVEVVEQAGQRPLVGIAIQLWGVMAHGRLDGEHVPAQAFVADMLGHDLPRFVAIHGRYNTVMLPESLKDAQRVLQAAKFDVYQTELADRDGQSYAKQFVVHNGAVVILPLLDDDRVVMIRNKRPAVDQTLWELPAGTLEVDEDPADCAGRELIEETGYEAGSIEPMCDFFSTPGFCTERMWVFVARELTHVGQQLEATEQITVEVLPRQETMQMMRDGEIMDAKTMTALLYYDAFGARDA